MDTDTPRIRRLRSLLAGAPRSGAGNRYPDDLRREVVAAIEEARSSGASLSGLATALGLPPTTLSRWSPPAAPRRGGLVRVDVVPFATRSATIASTPVVELPSGVRVHGLSLDDIVALHSRLT